jgi:hypothetical protein
LAFCRFGLDLGIHFRLSTMKAFLALTTFLYGQAVVACPACAASNMDNPEASNMAYILMIFIGLIYIPFYVLYRMVYKNRNFNQPITDQD